MITDGNFRTGWHLQDNFASKKIVEVSPKDKKFSLSSVMSKASLDLIKIEDRKLTVPFQNK